MKKDFRGNSRYFKLNEFNFGFETEKTEFEKEINDKLVVEDFIYFLERYCLERIPNSKIGEIFGLAYVSSGEFAMITLDTNNYVFIDEYYYMTYLAVGDDDETYLACSCIETDEEVFFKIS